MKGIVIMPTYNEAGNIERILPMIMQDSLLDVLVVDDRSPDGTADIVKSQKYFNQRIFILERPVKNGLGRAYIDGFNKALEMNYDFVVQMDADLSHNPQALGKFVEALQEGYQAVVGSRYIGGVRVLDWDIKRLFLSIFANIYARIVTGVPLTDLTGGYNAYTRKALQKIDLDSIYAKGYMFQIEIKSFVFYAHLPIQEVPIVFIDRTIGETKLQGSIIYEAVFGCIFIRIKHLINRIFSRKA